MKKILLAIFLLFLKAVFLGGIRGQYMEHDYSQIFTNSNSYFNRPLYDTNDLSMTKDGLHSDFKPRDRGPYFDISASRNVTALVGKSAHLNCRIRNLGNKTVSWIRHRDLHLLTVAENTYTSDQRFISINNKQTGDWSLQVKYPQIRDSGIYECQVSTSPPVGYTMILSIVEPITNIVGGPDLYIDTGSTVNLTCVVKHLPEPPPSVLWTHDNVEINYDSPRGGVSVITEKGDITTSYLLIQRARISDSGRYTCSPSTANPKSVHVHVLNGEQPAAIQRAAVTLIKNKYLTFISIILSTVIQWIFLRKCN